MVDLVERESKLNLKETELCLGLPGGRGETSKNTMKRGYSDAITDLKLNLVSEEVDETDPDENKSKNNFINPAQPPAAKAQVVGWPPVRSFRKNMVQKKSIIKEETTGFGASFVKVSMDGAPYLRKVDLKMYKTYQELTDALSKMFSSFTFEANSGSEGMMDFMNESKLMDLLSDSKYLPTYEDKDGDWMLVGDVPWEMFVGSCKRLRIMKGSEAIGLAPRAVEKCRNRS